MCAEAPFITPAKLVKPDAAFLSLIFALLPHCCQTGVARRRRAARVTGRCAADDDLALTTGSNKSAGYGRNGPVHRGAPIPRSRHVTPKRGKVKKRCWA